MADGLVIKHPVTGVVIFNSSTITSHSRGAFSTNGSAGSVNLADVLRGSPYIIQALPISENGIDYGTSDFSISGSTISWTSATRSMRVIVGSKAIGGAAGSKVFDGFLVRRPGGALQVSTADFSLQLSTIGSAILVDDGQAHPQPMVIGSVTITGTNPVLAFRGQAGKEIGVRRVTSGAGQFTFYFACRSSTQVGLIYWAFDTTGQALSIDTDAALVLKDAFGSKTFDSRSYALNDVTTSAGGSVSPSPGQSLAVIQSTFGWLNSMQDLGSYSNQVQRPGSIEVGGEPQWPRPIGTRWAYMELLSSHAAASFDSGGAVSFGLRNFESFRDWYSSDALPSSNVQGVATHTVIDVTNLPSAAMPDTSGIAVSLSSSVREVTSQTQTTANTITPPSVATGSGGTPPYSYEWQRVSGSPDVVAYDSIYSQSFRTQSNDQPGGQTRTAQWRCRVTDSIGRSGYSEEVTFRHIVELVDYVPDPVNWESVSASTPSNIGAVLTNYQTISGITSTITLRFVVSYSGNLTGGSFNVFSSTRNQFLGTLALGSGSIDVSVQPNETINMYCDGVTDSGIRSGQWSVEVRNQFTAGGVIDTATLGLVVDEDNNHNVTNYFPNPITTPNQSLLTDDYWGRTTPTYFQIVGTTATITLRFTRSNNTGSAALRRQYIYTGPTQSGPWTEYFMGINTAPLEISTPPGTWFRVEGAFETSSGRAVAGWDMSIANLFTGGSVIGSWSVNGTVDNNNDYNVPDYSLTPGAISFYSNNADSYGGDVSASFGGGYANGINQSITLTAIISPVYRGGAVASYFTVYVGSGSAAWNIGDTSYQSFSFTVSPGQYVGASAAMSMFAGSGDAWAYWHVDLYNSTTGEYVSGFDGALTTSR